MVQQSLWMTMSTYQANLTTKRSVLTASTIFMAMVRRQTSRTGRRVQAKTNLVYGNRTKPHYRSLKMTLC